MPLAKLKYSDNNNKTKAEFSKFISVAKLRIAYDSQGVVLVSYDTGYPHDGRADKDSYPHDGRADKDSYPHDRHNQYIMLSL